MLSFSSLLSSPPAALSYVSSVSCELKAQLTKFCLDDSVGSKVGGGAENGLGFMDAATTIVTMETRR